MIDRDMSSTPIFNTTQKNFHEDSKHTNDTVIDMAFDRRQLVLLQLYRSMHGLCGKSLQPLLSNIGPCALHNVTHAYVPRLAHSNNLRTASLTFSMLCAVKTLPEWSAHD